MDPPDPEQLLAAIVAAVDDGFYPASRLALTSEGWRTLREYDPG